MVTRISEIFEGVKDPRQSNATRYSLHEMLMIGLLSTLSGGEGCSDMALYGEVKEEFLREFLDLPHGIPSHDAFSDLFNALDPLQLNEVMIRLLGDISEGLKGVVAVDGKALRGSYEKAVKNSALHVVQAFACESRLVLGQVAVDQKSNEITALPELLKLLKLEGCIVTADAMHTQRESAQLIGDQGADYALALKGNQGRLAEDVQTFFDDPGFVKDCQSFQAVDKDHGRLETRLAIISSDVQWLQQEHNFPHLQAIGQIVATREINGKTYTHSRLYLLSNTFDAQHFLEITRTHWAIENSLHWVLDVVMNEDAMRNRTLAGPQNLALLRRIVLNLVRALEDKGSLRGKIKRAAWDDRFLLKILKTPAPF